MPGNPGWIMEKYKQRLSKSFSVKARKQKPAADSDDSTSPWKFWRRFSARGRSEHKPFKDRDRPTITLLEKRKEQKIPECFLDDTSRPTPGSGPLPDVVEKTLQIFPPNAVPPPKPPRQFLARTPSTVSKHSDASERHADHIYSNSDAITKSKDNNNEHEFVLKQRSEPQIATLGKTNHLSPNGIPACDIVADSHLSPVKGKPTQSASLSIYSTRRPSDTAEHLDTKSLSNCSACPAVETSYESKSSNNSPIPRQKLLNASRGKPKIRSPDLGSRRHRRCRRKSSSESGRPVSRQKHIMNSVSELLRQTLDPYPLLDPLKKFGLLNNVDIQGFLGHHDRKSVCEGLVDVIAESNMDSLALFCSTLAATKTNTETLEVLQVMREIDRIVHDVPSSSTKNPALDEEKKITYEVGYIAPDHSIKPLVELERVRSSNDKRYSKASCRNSVSSYGEGFSEGSLDGNRTAIENGVIPGLVMMSICITGHNMSGEKTEALGSLIKNSNCVCELRLGKTLLRGEDVTVIAKALENNRTIHSLDLRLNSLDYAGAQSVGELLKTSRTLRILNLSSCSLSLESIKVILSSVAVSKSLTDLDLSFLDINDECGEALRDMIRGSVSLQKLRLRSNNLTWSGCYLIGEGMAKSMSLCVLDLSQNSIGNNGIQALAKVLPDSSITELYLENCGFTTSGCSSLAELILHCKHLKNLDISTNQFQDSGVLKLATALERSSSLQRLGLNMCGLSNDAFYKLLDVLEKNISIINVKLCFNYLGEKYTNPTATSENLKYRLKIITSSRPGLKIRLWGNSIDDD